MTTSGRGAELERLRESEERHRYAFEAAGVSLWEEDCTEVMALLARLQAVGVRDLRAYLELHPEVVREAVELVRVTDVNQEALRAFGARTKDELKASLARTFTDRSFAVFKEELIALAEGRKSFATEAELCTLTGEPRLFQITATFPPSPEALDRVLMTLVDITERKRTEEALRRSEERYRAFVVNSSEGIWRYELEEPLDVTRPVDEQLEHLYRHARLAELNDTTARMYGFERAEELVGARLDHTLPRDDSAAAAYLRRAIESGFSCRDLESTERDRAGRERHFANTMVPAYENGKLVRVWGVQRDITARREAEEALRRSETRFRRVIETAPVGIAFSETDGRVVLANDTLLTLLGATREDIENESLDWQRFTPPEYLHLDLAHLEELRRGGLPAPFEKELIRRDGSRVSCLIVARFLPGEGERMVAYAVDITERKRADAALREADRRKDEFLATLAHELRNPLAPIRNAVHLLKSDPPAPQANAAREIIARQVQHMVRLVDDLLEVSRITLGHVNLQHERLTLGQLVRDALDAVGPIIEETGHELEVHLAAEPLRLDGDGTRLSQVFQNLLNNACKYTPRGGRVALRAERIGAEAVVSVRDDGVGIPKDMQARVFELFTRLHPIDSIKASGLGIGLALSKRLVELHGGRIEIESEGAGRGSEFRVYLPLAERAEPSAAPRVSEPFASVGGIARRILVVDDNRDAAESLAMLLEQWGSVVTTAFDGARALEALEAFGPEIVLLDIGMPGMDGYEVAQRMRARPRGKEVLLVALTGWGQAEDKKRARAAGFDVHLTKPVDPAVLNRLIGAAASFGR